MHHGKMHPLENTQRTMRGKVDDPQPERGCDRRGIRGRECQGAGVAGIWCRHSRPARMPPTAADKGRLNWAGVAGLAATKSYFMCISCMQLPRPVVSD